MSGCDTSNDVSFYERHVYLVEDDVDLCRELATTLSDDGFVVHAFESAEAFLSAETDFSPSVIVSDMVLPGLSGLRLFEAIREAGIETPLVFISGYSEPQQIIAAMKLGAVDFLWKPFNSAALLKAVHEALKIDIERSVRSNEVADIEERWRSLSEREAEVCKLMLRGYGNKEVSCRLNIQSDTANKHRMKVLKKMGVAGRPQLIELMKDFDLASN